MTRLRTLLTTLMLLAAGPAPSLAQDRTRSEPADGFTRRYLDMGDGTHADRVVPVLPPGAAPLPVQGSRPNAGTGLDAGGSHLTVGGSDGTNVRPMRVAPDGRLVSTIPTAGSTGNGQVTTPAAGGAACTVLPSQAADLVEFAIAASGAQVEYQVGGAGAFFPMFTGYVVQVPGITNLNQLCVRRTDQSTTTSTVAYRWFTR
jgi:hypothetical protein